MYKFNLVLLLSLSILNQSCPNNLGNKIPLQKNDWLYLPWPVSQFLMRKLLEQLTAHFGLSDGFSRTTTSKAMSMIFPGVEGLTKSMTGVFVTSSALWTPIGDKHLEISHVISTSLLPILSTRGLSRGPYMMNWGCFHVMHAPSPT